MRYYKTAVFFKISAGHFGSESLQAVDCSGTDNHMTLTKMKYCC